MFSLYEENVIVPAVFQATEAIDAHLEGWQEGEPGFRMPGGIWGRCLAFVKKCLRRCANFADVAKKTGGMENMPPCWFRN